MFDRAVTRPDVPAGSERVGCYYERGQITVDRLGRLWVVYRHFYAPEFLGGRRFDEGNIGHTYAVFARYLDGTDFSKLVRLDIKQGDGAQRLAITPSGNGVAALWTTGQTNRNFQPIQALDGDRDTTHLPRGLALATLGDDDGRPTGRLATTVLPPTKKPAIPSARAAQRPPGATVADKAYTLFYGELHRHTDLSRCYSMADGSLDDAFRYAIDAAALDFVGITDHACDLNWGNPAGQVWWRTGKANDRHHLRAAFVPLYAFEHSRSSFGFRETDHNVISLRWDILRPEAIGYPELCNQMGSDTFIIPHAPINSHKHSIWDFWPQPGQRPLLEIYQGFRHGITERSEQAAADGLARGHRFGFIASTDHLATSAGYACVWAADRSRESIFRALQARRTFAAMSKIRLIVRAGDRWMGEEFVAPSMPAIQIEADAEVPFQKIEIILDGQVVKSLPADKRSISLTYEPGPTAPGAHYLYVRLTQTDASLAWSSPIFVEVKP
jgi:hypothetical protein